MTGGQFVKHPGGQVDHQVNITDHDDPITRGVPDFEDEQSRYIEAVIMPDDRAPVRVGGLYLPNGNPAPGPKYDYKLAWMDAFYAHARHLLSFEEATVLCGDYNVIPEPEGCYAPQVWADDALFRLESRTAFRRILNLQKNTNKKEQHKVALFLWSNYCYPYVFFIRCEWR